MTGTVEVVVELMSGEHFGCVQVADAEEIAESTPAAMAKLDVLRRIVMWYSNQRKRSCKQGKSYICKWIVLGAQGLLEGTGRFLLRQCDQGVITMEESKVMEAASGVSHDCANFPIWNDLYCFERLSSAKLAVGRELRHPSENADSYKTTHLTQLHGWPGIDYEVILIR